MTPDELFGVMRHLASPIVALTCTWQGKVNGMIANSAMRASLLPTVPRVAVFISKQNLSHELIWQSGCFAMHLLDREQWEVIWQLGFFSGRERDKLAVLPYRTGVTGCPILEDAYAWFDCQVINVMDNGSSTCFLGDVVEAGRGRGDACMTSDYFRAHMPPEWLPLYQEQLVETQEFAARYSRQVQPVTW